MYRWTADVAVASFSERMLELEVNVFLQDRDIRTVEKIDERHFMAADKIIQMKLK